MWRSVAAYSARINRDRRPETGDTSNSYLRSLVSDLYFFVDVTEASVELEDETLPTVELEAY
jgi:hypothetical protein